RHTTHLHSFPTRRSSDLALSDIPMKNVGSRSRSLIIGFFAKGLLLANAATVLYEAIDRNCNPRSSIGSRNPTKPRSILPFSSARDRKSTRLNSSHDQISY